MAVQITCQVCGTSISLKDQLAGRQIKCPVCSAELTVEKSIAAPVSAPPPPSRKEDYFANTRENREALEALFQQGRVTQQEYNYSKTLLENPDRHPHRLFAVGAISEKQYEYCTRIIEKVVALRDYNSQVSVRRLDPVGPPLAPQGYSDGTVPVQFETHIPTSPQKPATSLQRVGEIFVAMAILCLMIVPVPLLGLFLLVVGYFLVTIGFFLNRKRDPVRSSESILKTGFLVIAMGIIATGSAMLILADSFDLPAYEARILFFISGLVVYGIPALFFLTLGFLGKKGII